MNAKLIHDQQVRRYLIFLLSLSLFLFIAAMLFCSHVTRDAKKMLLHHDETIAASLSAQGIPNAVIAQALTDTDVRLDAKAIQARADVLAKMGIRPELETQFLPQLRHFEKNAVICALALVLLVCEIGRTHV